MSKPLLTHQKKFYNKLRTFMEKEDFACIIGKSGVGKSFLSNRLCKDYSSDNYVTLLFTGDKLNQYRPYYPFQRVLNNENLLYRYRDIPIEISKDIPYIGNFVSIILKRLINKEAYALQQKYPYLNKEENDIISRFKYITKNKKVLLIFDNFQWWDKQSINLLNTIISTLHNLDFCLVCKSIFIFTSSHLKNSLFNSLKDTKIPFLKFKEMSYSQFMKDRQQLGFLKVIEEKQLKFIYKLADGNIFLFRQIAKELPNETYFSDNDKISGIQYLNKLLERRMTEFGATGKQIMYVLEFGSTIGLSFSDHELKYVTQIKEGQFTKIIKCAKEWSLVENDIDDFYYKFVHDIILEIFKHRTENNSFEYYEKLEECLRVIKPGSYLRRARYCVYMRDLSKAVLRYILELLKELRDNNIVYTEIENEALGLMDDTIRKYYFYMKEAYNLYLEKKYWDALALLEKIPLNLNCLLLAERDLLRSRCLSKSEKRDNRQKAVNILKKYYDNSFVKREADLWERLMTSLVTAYYHSGYKDNAQDLEEELLSSLSERSQFDLTANLRIHILLRNSNSIHDSEFAEEFIKKSVDYFGQKTNYGLPVNILEYYKALLNYSATLCKNGKFQEAFHQTQIAINLENDFQDINFPRTQILYNNYVVTGFLANEIVLTDGIQILETIVDNIPPIAERIFYTSNLCIFYILNNELYTAESYLNQEIKNYEIDMDVEGAYKYRVYLIYSIIEYFKKNNQKASDFINISLNCIHTITDHSYIKKKIELFYDHLNQEERILVPAHLDNYLLEKVPCYQNSVWKFLGHVFPYSILSNWDI